MIRLIENIKEKGDFNNLATHPLQTWEWGEFRKTSGNLVFRFGVYKKDKMIKSFQMLGHTIPKTKFKIATLIKSPPLNPEELEFIVNFAKKNSIIFIRIEYSTPTNCGSIKHKNISAQNTLETMIKLGAKKGKTLFTPTTFWIDLTKSEEELFSKFHPKTRYNIRLAQKRGVAIKEDNSQESFNSYLQLTEETVKRQGFYAHTKKYHQKMWNELHDNMVKLNTNPIAHLFVAKYKGQTITSWIIFVWKDFLYYPYGASSDKYKEVMANNLMLWECIKYGKQHKLKIFDLWGREEGKGFTKFKEGYNPEVIEFIGTWDIPTNILYYPYILAEKIRWYLLRYRTKIGFTKPSF